MEEKGQALEISYGSFSPILHYRLGMRKLAARWVPKFLIEEQMSTSASVGWLVGCFGFNGPLRQYFSLYRAVSLREGERGEKG